MINIRMSRQQVIDFDREMQAISKESTAALQRDIARAAINIESDAKRGCPVDTGRLRASIHIVSLEAGQAAEVGTNVEYAPFVEARKPYLYPAAAKYRRKLLDDIARSHQNL